ncbi:MAG: hypothetical protein JWR19_3668 [Pedosphaera sp.]|nr:hypothetical protein [Pedosphaera sp.]
MRIGMNLKLPSIIAALVLAALSSTAASATYSPATVEPPWVSREFRAVWIATVKNVDWPSRPGLPVEQQQAEMLAILDRAVKMNLNAVIFQVRPACDTLYESHIEPWSYYLTGVMGQAPRPFYDPLNFAISEAHKRGLELHAWFSPYRAGFITDKISPAANHFSRTRPDLVRKYGSLLWLDPGEKEVQAHAIAVIMDVVNRYDIDGIHFDDRLAYPEKDGETKNIEFPDLATWKRYLADGGNLSRDDWRRENVNTFVHNVYDAIKAAKPWVKVGIAPPGIWQPGYPSQIKGRNNYATLYVDARKWLMKGWVDYLSPQLYWSIAQPDTSFPVLLKWWLEQNPKHRNIWPGLNSGNVGSKWRSEEIIDQIKITREQCGGVAGAAHYSAKCLLEDRGGLASALANGIYAKPALVPPSPWLEKQSPAKPLLLLENGRKAKWETAGLDKVSAWVLQTRVDNQWQTRILPGGTRSLSLTDSPDIVAITAIDRCGVASPPNVLQKAANPAKQEALSPTSK